MCGDMMIWRIDRKCPSGETEVLGRVLSQSHFDHHKSNTDSPGIEHGPLQTEAGVIQPELWCGLRYSFSSSGYEIRRINDTIASLCYPGRLPIGR
jgi:hypothetical protein